jgi:hypothetical protein
MINPSELLFVRVEASEPLRNAIDKLLHMPGASALTREERCEIAALNLQIALAQWHYSRIKHAGTSY